MAFSICFNQLWKLVWLLPGSIMLYGRTVDSWWFDEGSATYFRLRNWWKPNQGWRSPHDVTLACPLRRRHCRARELFHPFAFYLYACIIPLLYLTNQAYILHDILLYTRYRWTVIFVCIYPYDIFLYSNLLLPTRRSKRQVKYECWYKLAWCNYTNILKRKICILLPKVKSDRIN